MAVFWFELVCRNMSLVNCVFHVSSLTNQTFYLNLFCVHTAQPMTHLLTEVISGDSMGSLIIQPSGSGEENMASMTLPVIATLYLDKTNQWKTVGLQKRNEALEHIRKG